MSSTWVVAADSSRARIFEVGRSRAELREIGDLVNPDARLHERDLTSDDKGRAYDSFGSGRHAMEDKVSAKQQNAIDFAGRINEQLLSDLNQGKYDRLYLMAAPDFLGVLREKLDPHVRKTIAAEINKSLARHSTEDIAKHLP